MLIEITRMCNEQCTHCMVNATPAGPHMDMRVFKTAVDFGIHIGAHTFSISGGDPFLHPECFKMFRHLLNKLESRQAAIMIESNGWWIEDEKMCSRIKKLLDNPLVFGMQISSNKKYYPNYEWTCSHKDDYEKLHNKIKFLVDWQGEVTNIHYMGRAVNILKEDEIKGVPPCLNYISVALQYDQLGLPQSNRLKHLVKYMEFVRNKTCAPYVDVNGYIRVSEGCDCRSVGNVKEMPLNAGEWYFEKIFKNIQGFIPCNRCKALKNLPSYKLDALNELRLRLGYDNKIKLC